MEFAKFVRKSADVFVFVNPAHVVSVEGWQGGGTVITTTSAGLGGKYIIHVEEGVDQVLSDLTQASG